MKHIWYKCSEDAQKVHHEEGSCMFCEGGLGLCTVCKGFEGQLTTDCCGRKLDQGILDEVYVNGLDYIDGHWVYKERYKPEQLTGDMDEKEDS